MLNISEMKYNDIQEKYESKTYWISQNWKLFDIWSDFG